MKPLPPITPTLSSCTVIRPLCCFCQILDCDRGQHPAREYSPGDAGVRPSVDKESLTLIR
jgi:hypothetical protein